MNTDKAAAHAPALEALKKEGGCPECLVQRQVEYLNNQTESDHGKLKHIIKPTLGFKSMKTAYATIKGFEVMCMFKKSQMTMWYHA